VCATAVGAPDGGGGLAPSEAARVAEAAGGAHSLPPSRAAPLPAPAVPTLESSLAELGHTRVRIIVSEALLQRGALLASLRAPRGGGGAGGGSSGGAGDIGGCELVERSLPLPIDAVLDGETAVSFVDENDFAASEAPSGGGGGAPGATAGAPRARAPAPAPAAAAGAAPPRDVRSFVRALAAQAHRFSRIHVIVLFREGTSGSGGLEVSAALRAAALAAQPLSHVTFHYAANAAQGARFVCALLHLRARAAVAAAFLRGGGGEESARAARSALGGYASRAWLAEEETPHEATLAALPMMHVLGAAALLCA
jgi:hypothetical protein